MELKDLQSGMIVELRNRDKYVFIKDYLEKEKDTLCGLEKDNNIANTWGTLITNYNSDLTHKRHKDLDIMSVHKSIEYALNREESFVWRREEELQTVDMTMEEICEALGKKIRIVMEE